ncbi:iron-sulfur cluster insertion protein ErpA [Halorhodospira halophila]|uniref:Iron-sulfur cluster insertion protein ErpA n=1 Tax=Halorhodospira halophila (strain DSM 244 / SL1) TaxID=349124 RepID=ERPA_HALHL|nr:iron-sulfur cluster insertion protein ErpA [Halorhodospira halophila]A1WVE3.1 RecName: Full=Iron-sulfur cluster insertion protein ErpA [Halorhodospira halophila SL1]ABM61655.1 iron-sulfur cluster assembly accessory protein [Halorhodospira halophila SL1]
MSDIAEPETHAPADDQLLIFTDAAADKVRELLDGEEGGDVKLRVFITGGGCSGFQYGFTFDETVEEGDTIIEKRGVKIVVDPVSGIYLQGAEVDFSSGLEGEQFIIRNPNATTTCGCGSSFAI